jgi:hypothetical protein
MDASITAPFDIRDSVVRPISREAAARVITLFEPMPAIVTHTFGLFFGDTLAAVCCFGPHYLANIRAQPGCIALLRGACLPQAPRNSGSRLIRGAMRQLPPQYRVVTAFADALHGAALEGRTGKTGTRILARRGPDISRPTDCRARERPGV